MNSQDQSNNFFQPLKNRPDIDPDPIFVKKLKKELLQQSTKIEKTRMKFAPIIIGTLTIAICFALTFLYINYPKTEIDLAGDDPQEPSINEESTALHKDIEILENEEMNLIFEVNYGDNTEDIAFPKINMGGSDYAPSSFFVKDDTFFILDNTGKKVVVTTQNKHLFTIQLNEDLWMNDIFVDDENNIYVLAVREVYKFSGDGNLLGTYPIHQFNLSFNEISVDSKKNILVKDIQNRIMNVMTDERVEKKEVGHLFRGASNKIITKNQIIERVTTVAEDIPVIMAEMHLYVRNKEGELLGGVREPHELNEYYTDQNIRVVDGKIIYMSAGKEKVSFYELKPGKNFEKRLQDRVDEYKANGEENEAEYRIGEEREETEDGILSYPVIYSDSPVTFTLNEKTKQNLVQFVEFIKDEFPNHPNGKIETEFVTHLNRLKLVSIELRASFSDESLAHPVGFSRFLNFNVEEGTEYTFSEVFENIDSMNEFVKELIIQSNALHENGESEKAPIGFVTQNVDETNVNENTMFYFTPESVMLFFKRYELNTFTPIEIPIPSQYINPLIDM